MFKALEAATADIVRKNNATADAATGAAANSARITAV
jgi:hypothetical protein